MLENNDLKRIVRLRFSLRLDDIMQDFNEQICMNAIHNILSIPHIYHTQSETLVVATNTEDENLPAGQYSQFVDYMLYIVTFYQSKEDSEKALSPEGART